MAKRPTKKATVPAAPTGPVMQDTITGLMVVYEMARDLCDDALAEVEKMETITPADADVIAQIVGPIVTASQCLAKACVAAGILPAEILTEIEKEVATADAEPG